MVSAATSLEGNKLQGRAGSGDQDPEELGKSAPNPQDSSAKALVVGTLLEAFVTEQEGGLEWREGHLDPRLVLEGWVLWAKVSSPDVSAGNVKPAGCWRGRGGRDVMCG